MNLQNVKAVLVAIQLKTYTNERTDEQTSQEVRAERQLSADAGNWHHFKLKPAWLEPLKKLRSKIRNWHYAITLDWEQGRQLLPAAKFVASRTELAQWQNQYVAELEKFLEQYPGYIEERRRDLNGTFDRSDYPDAETMRRLFTCQALFYPIPDEAHVSARLGPEVAQAMRDSVGASNEDRLENALASLWLRILEPVHHMAQKLADPQEVFRDSLVENLRAMLQEAPSYDFLKNPDVAVALKTIETQLASVTPETLRTNETTRASVAKAAAKLVKTYGKPGGRKLNLN